MEFNTLYYGDNLTILRKYIPDESIDLIYLDPPFNSKATYNVLFKEPTGEQSKAQAEAFEDTWHWTEETERTFEEIVDTAPPNVVNLMNALKDAIHKNDMMAYLTMMCIRLLELKRVLKDTGSIYLHCDPMASHYLKILMDSIFGGRNFRNEIIWHYKSFHGQTKRYFPKKHDTIFWYTKGKEWKFKRQFDKDNTNTIDFKRWNKYLVDDYKILGKNMPIQDSRFVRFYNRWVREHGRKPNPDEVVYEVVGQAFDTVWDIKPVDPKAFERLGYPTQKPETLLERIIKASSNEGDTVLDPFCGCGTALVAAHELKRKWIGIDVTHLAISLMKWRLKSNFSNIEFKVIGEPLDLSGAKALSDQNKYQFQWWALSLIDARPYGDKKKGADRGIDGYYYFNDGGKTKKAIVSVKGGHVTVSQVRDLNSVIEREKASMGFFITLNHPTRPMKEEATERGFYKDSFGNEYPKVQILTIEEILNGKKPDTPQKVPIFESTTKGKELKKGEQKTLS
jgi:site-specific DNA-methyltransferase (adenine-specific)